MSASEREESEVEEAECRGESEGETAADSESVTVVEVTLRLRAGACLGIAEVDAILKERYTADRRESRDAEDKLSKRREREKGE